MSRTGRFGSDAPDGIAYLPLAGGGMTGDITMAGAQKVDGIDISTYAAADAHHAKYTDAEAKAAAVLAG